MGDPVIKKIQSEMPLPLLAATSWWKLEGRPNISSSLTAEQHTTRGPVIIERTSAKKDGETVFYTAPQCARLGSESHP